MLDNKKHQISFNIEVLLNHCCAKDHNNSLQIILWYFTKTVFGCSSFSSRVKGYQMLLLALVTGGEMCQTLL